MSPLRNSGCLSRHGPLPPNAARKASTTPAAAATAFQPGARSSAGVGIDGVEVIDGIVTLIGGSAGCVRIGWRATTIALPRVLHQGGKLAAKAAGTDQFPTPA